MDVIAAMNKGKEAEENMPQPCFTRQRKMSIACKWLRKLYKMDVIAAMSRRKEGEENMPQPLLYATA